MDASPKTAYTHTRIRQILARITITAATPQTRALGPGPPQEPPEPRRHSTLLILVAEGFEDTATTEEGAPLEV